MSLLAIGSYTSESDGRGAGITLAELDEVTGAVTVLDQLALPSPSWLQWHPSLPVLYAANEIDDGTVSAVQIEDGNRLRLLNTASTGGGQPCHLAISLDGRRLYAANYSGGSLAAFTLAADGSITGRSDLVIHTGHGPDPDRQDGPHVHMAVLSHDNANDSGTGNNADGSNTANGGDELITAVDLGIDQLRSYRMVAGRLTGVAVTQLPAGCGPRQLIRAAGRAYLVAELSAQLLTLDEPEPGRFEVRGAVPASEQPFRNLPAQFSLSADGRLGYLSNRYPDSIAVFDLSATPTRLVEFPVGPGWPRHFALAGDWLINANQHGDQLSVFALGADGRPAGEVGRHQLGTPTCVALRP